MKKNETDGSERLTRNNICTSEARKPLLWGRSRWESVFIFILLKSTFDLLEDI